MNDLIILGLLSGGSKHGYQLKREAGFMLGHGDMHNNLVYPLLRRFTTAGWVTKKTVPGERGQTRQQYELTAKGRHELIRRLAEFKGTMSAPKRLSVHGSACLSFWTRRHGNRFWKSGRLTFAKGRNG